MRASVVWKLAILLVVFSSGSISRAEIRTINLDFGNGGVYAGDDGVLSSPGGTFWNEVTVSGSSSGQPGFVEAFHLRDEFGQAFDLPVGLPGVNAFMTDVDPTIGSGSGPLADGVTLSNAFGGLVIRELSSESPIEVVVYFADPSPGDARRSVVGVQEYIGSESFQTELVTSTGGSGAFPGTGPIPSLPPGVFTAIDYVRFDQLTPSPTTIGIPLLPGLFIGPPEGEVAHIAAIQIRGEFVFTPEPTSAVLVLIACGLATSRRVTSGR